MPRQFLTITQDDIDAKIMENLNSRENELASYDFERVNHEAAIAALGDIKWDGITRPYKGLARDVMIARALGDGLTSEQIQAISDLNTLEYHKANLEAVKIETAKSERQYDNLVASIPACDRFDTALTKFTEKQATEQALRSARASQL
jgi:hypothetical protein